MEIRVVAAEFGSNLQLEATMRTDSGILDLGDARRALRRLVSAIRRNGGDAIMSDRYLGASEPTLNLASNGLA